MLILSLKQKVYLLHKEIPVFANFNRGNFYEIFFTYSDDRGMWLFGMHEKESDITQREYAANNKHYCNNQYRQYNYSSLAGV